MADGELRLTLNDEMRRRLGEAAEAAGMSIEAYALGVLLDELDSDPLSISRARLAEYRRTGESISVEEAMTHFDAELEAALARKR
ncbi:hypothetical protein [uncultured Phenylobacterium sp.]|uniref:hypothetical protein n=1 Tax=uncultured Phenylobacterium sp. TaxID=349273 RepID=UPI0025FC398F|nr:hypothetical protein [uncultured Phenylobacterium sp.]